MMPFKVFQIKPNVFGSKQNDSKNSQQREINKHFIPHNLKMILSYLTANV